MRSITLDTLGKLDAYHYGMWGYCLARGDKAHVYSVKDETGKTFEANFSSRRVQREFAQIASERRERRDAIFRRQNIDSLPLSTDKDYFPILHSFFQHREQRLKRGG